MFNCPGCGAGMRYDIKTAKMLCDHCGTSCEVQEHPAQSLMAAQDDYETTVFTCPQCGGRILSTDHAASDFCTYCGASVTLQGRLSTEKKPERIIPFSRTREECRESYRNYTRKIWCLPDEYRSDQFLDKFEGIYIPFWIYQAAQVGPAMLGGRRTSGNYIEYSHLNFDLNSHYDWIPFDAASLFDDEISSEINTFDESEAVPFNPAYLSGFYADIPDVDASVYQKEAENEANRETVRRVRESGLFKRIKIEESGNYSAILKTRPAGHHSAMFPVWFVTWRNKDRVAYAAVNGSSGDCAADLPVSFSKYLLTSLLISLPCILLFLMLPVMMAKTMLTAALMIGAVMMVLYYRSAVRTAARELHILDKGYMSSRPASEVPSFLKSAQRKMEDRKRSGKGEKNTVAVWIGLIFAGSLMMILPALISSGVAIGNLLFPAAALAAIVGAVVFTIKGSRIARVIHFPRIILDCLILSVCCTAAAVIGIINPVHDYYYYFGAVLVMGGIIAAVLGLVVQYNRLCTHPIPEYFKREEVGKNA